MKWPLPTDYEPMPPKFFHVERIVIARGSLATPERRQFVERIAALYPQAERTECLDTTHNRIDIGESDDLRRHRKGKTTLVFGEHKSAVQFSEEEGNTCPNYWHVSATGFCFYDCRYCYLAGTRTYWHSPAIRVFVNLDEIISAIDRTARQLEKPTAFYFGKLQDGLSLDPLTGLSKELVPFFAEHPYARQVILTKSDAVENLLPLEHKGHTILSWSLNPPEIAARFEANVPSVEERLATMKRCTDAGYPVRAVLMPIIPVPNWKEQYAVFLDRLLTDIPLSRLTLGGICSYQGAMRLMEAKLGKANPISESLSPGTLSADGRRRYSKERRVEIYRFLMARIRSIRPNLELALCLEEHPVWEAVGLADGIGRCNCVL